MKKTKPFSKITLIAIVALSVIGWGVFNTQSIRLTIDLRIPDARSFCGLVG